MLYKFTDDDVLRFCHRMVRDDSGCWLWTAGVDDWGYGRFSYQGHVGKAHRVAWMMTHGEIPEGIRVLHHCDTPACCNPDHLFLGTDEDNRLDMIAKGRQRHGSYGKDSRSERACFHCGATFLVFPSQPRKYCSWACANAGKTGVHLAIPTRVEKAETTCPICGNTFRHYAGQPRKYCSDKCKGIGVNAGRKTRLIKSCISCGLDFWTVPSQPGYYCSSKCFGRWSAGRPRQKRA
jgi:hypothetical protein